MQILKNTLTRLSESERRELVIRLSERLGVHESTIYRWANGSTTPSHPIVTERLINELNELNLEIKSKSKTVTAFFPGLGNVQISQARAAQILRLQKIIKEQNNKEAKTCSKSN